MSSQDFEASAAKPSRRGLFENNRQDPSHAVTAGVFQISTAVSTFKRLVNILGTPKDTPELREKLHKTRQNIGNLAKETSARLKSVSETDHLTPVSAGKKVADAKAARDLQAVLKDFQKAQKLAAERERTYTPFVAQAVLPSSYTASDLKLAPEEAQEQRRLLDLLDEQRQKAITILLGNEIVSNDFNEAIIEERNQGIREVKQQMWEVNEIFKDLAVLVHEQGVQIEDIDPDIEGSHAATVQENYQEIREVKQQMWEVNEIFKDLAVLAHEQGVQIEDIDADVESSHAATVQANLQLVKASKIGRSNSSLTCLLLVIFGVALLILIIVMAA